MKSVFTAFVFFSCACYAGATAFGQHLHRHGNHYHVHQNVAHGHDAAGHMVDRYGHHINGDGQHTGYVGVYDNGSYGSHGWSGALPLPSYSSSFYSNSLYSTPSYSGSYYSGSIYNAPVVVPTQPSVVVNSLPSASSIVTNKIPMPAGSSSQVGGATVLVNPKTTGGPISYSLNEFTYTIKPGETQTIPLDRQWVIKFNNGLGRIVSQRLEPGTFEFTVSPTSGWDMAKRIDPPAGVSTLSPAPPSPLPENAIPRASF